MANKSKTSASRLIVGAIITGYVGTTGIYKTTSNPNKDLGSEVASNYVTGDTYSVGTLSNYSALTSVTNSIISNAPILKNLDEELWNDIDALFGAWSQVEGIDEWMSDIRDSSDNRLKEIYGDEW